MISIFRINDIIDLPVFDSISGHRICTIRDVIIDLKEYRIYAFVCKEGLLRRLLEVVPFRNVSAISQNGVMVTGNTRRISLKELNMKHGYLQSSQDILGKMVLNSKGEALGIVRDILIDTSSGIIKAYELSEGYMDDFLSGRHIIELDRGHTLSGNNIVLEEYNSQCLFNSKMPGI